MNLNPEQQAAVNAHDGVWVCVSSPGSGKTTTLIARYLKMLVAGIPSKDILCLTFTNAAAKEMTSRAGLLNAESIFRTFHAFSMDLLKKEKDNLPFKLCDTVIPVNLEEYKLLFDLAKAYPAIKDWRTLQEKISEYKRGNISPDQAITEAQGMDKYYAEAYNEYEERSRLEGWLDFDSVMQETVRLLETNPQARSRHQRKYISVDEGQDTDIVQFKLLQLLFSENICIFGDENQLIYEWRSAQAGNLTNFSKLFPGAKTLYLAQNYRSTKQIVKFLLEILPVDNGLASRMFTENEDGVEPTFTKYADDVQEMEKILAKITDYEHTAIISRTNRQLFIYQRACAIRGIKYKILGKRDFFEQNEVKKLLHLAQQSGDMRSADVVLADTIRKHNLDHLYRHSGKPMESSPIENMNSLSKMAVGKGNIHEFAAYLQRLTRARRSSKGLTLTTVHQAKGLTFGNVFVIGAQQGMMPHKEGEIEEEKRVFFVACSRAAKTLEISFIGSPSEFYHTRWDKIKNGGLI